MTIEREIGHYSADRANPGWSSLHSWVFIVIVALGLLLTGYLNRYEYFSVGAKAYRVSKITGGIQEYNPIQGWVAAGFSETPPDMYASSTTQEPITPPPSPVEEPSQAAGAPEQTLIVGEEATPEPEPAPEDTAPQSPEPDSEPEETQIEPAEVDDSGVQPSDQEPEMSVEDRFKAFLQLNPGYGEEEFKLANETLYPHWKENIKPGGNFVQFLSAYKKFTQWWIDAGSPREPGFQLWKRFLSETNNGMNMP
jgi:hypothetical protein